MKKITECGHIEYKNVADEDSWDRTPESCIDGRIYGYCTAERCDGLCEYKGDCECTGCNSSMCCRKKEE